MKKPTGFDKLSTEDAGVILELSAKLGIAVVERLAEALTDKKFYIETAQGEKRLLCIGIAKHLKYAESGARAFEYAAAAGLITMRQIDIGVFHEETLMYALYTWLDGENLGTALSRMNAAERYSAGKKTGAVLRKMHSLPPLWEAEPWGVRFKRKVQQEIQFYNDKPIKIPSGDLLVRYLQDNLELTDNRPQTFVHGDFNCGNLMFLPDGQIGLIDYGNYCNDPWWDFREMTCNPNLPEHFATGLLKGYFEGEPPLEFFRLLCYYLVFAALEDSRDYTGEDDQEWTKAYLHWFDDMRNPVPTWYLKDYNAV